MSASEGCSKDLKQLGLVAQACSLYLGGRGRPQLQGQLRQLRETLSQTKNTKKRLSSVVW